MEGSRGVELCECESQKNEKLFEARANSIFFQQPLFLFGREVGTTALDANSFRIG